MYTHANTTYSVGHWAHSSRVARIVNVYSGTIPSKAWFTIIMMLELA